MALNRNPQAAKRARNDDFHAQLPDIQSELRHQMDERCDKGWALLRENTAKRETRMPPGTGNVRR